MSNPPLVTGYRCAIIDMRAVQPAEAKGLGEPNGYRIKGWAANGVRTIYLLPLTKGVVVQIPPGLWTGALPQGPEPLMLAHGGSGS